MSKRIHEERVPLGPRTDVVTHNFYLPANAFVLDCQLRHANLSVWFELEEGSEPNQPQRIVLVPNRHPKVPDGGLYMATVQAYDGLFVWHVYQVWVGEA